MARTEIRDLEVEVAKAEQERVVGGGSGESVAIGQYGYSRDQIVQALPKTDIVGSHAALIGTPDLRGKTPMMVFEGAGFFDCLFGGGGYQPRN